MKHQEFRQGNRQLAAKALKRLEELLASPDEQVALRAAKLIAERAFGRPMEGDSDDAADKLTRFMEANGLLKQ